MSSVRAADPPSALPRGTRLGEYEVQRVLGSGGFGIVYLALDHGLEREVAVKEYMPSALVGRTATLHVSLRSETDADTFALGLRSFVNEARLLARFDHPSLVKVHRFWEAHGTAYMAMPLYRGPTLRQVRKAMDRPPAEAWLRRLLDPLLGALAVLHEAGVYHRDIAPDNIVLEAEGLPVLLDFGAARRVIGDHTHTLTAILKPAYAPIEQYAEATHVKQGPWTDLYALGATLHYLLLGQPPAPATARAVHDDQPPLARQALPGCSPGFLATIDWMLAPRPADRPQSVAALREVLDGRRPVPRLAVAPAPADAFEPTIVVPRPAPAPAPSPPAGAVPRVRTPPPPPRSPVPWTVGGLVVAAAAVAGWAWWPGSPAPAEAAAASAPVAESIAPPTAPAVPAALPPLPDETREEAGLPPAPGAAPPVRPVSRLPAALPTGAVAAPASSVSGPETPPAPAPDRRPAAPPPPPARAAAAEPPPPPASPSQRCEGRLLVALSRCMVRECARAELRAHPECVKWRADLERLANPQQ